MILKAAICDDDLNDISIIRSYLTTYQMEYDIDFEVSVFSEADALIAEYTAPHMFHILFLDVEMPGYTGLEIARKIRELPDKNVKIVFISNYPEYMQDSFNVQAFHYLTKPLAFQPFRQLLNTIVADYSDTHITKLLIPHDGNEEFVYVDDIISIAIADSKKQVLTVTLSDKSLQLNGIFHEWEEKLKPLNFVMPYRGILVNLCHIHYFKNNSVIMDNGMSFPLSRRYEKQLRELFNRRIITISKNR